MTKASGFSLMEMVVVLLIGALIVLMAGQAYVMSVQNSLAQERTADAINQQIFGVDGFMANLRLAGLGIDDSVLANPMPAGILIHQDQLARQNKNGENLSNYLTKSNAAAKNTHTDVPSDQLTIIYRAPQDMWNCENELVLGPRRVRLKNGEMAQVDGQVVIERYFIQKDEGITSLRCAASKFITEDIKRDGARDRPDRSLAIINAIIDAEVKDEKIKTPNTIDWQDKKGQAVAHHIEGMWVRLGVQTAGGVRLMSPSEYVPDGRLPIVKLNIALLSHSPSQLADTETGAREFDVFGKKIHLTSGAPNYDRRLHLVSVDLRNITNSDGVP